MNELRQHLETKEQERTPSWDDKFFKLFSDCNLKILSSDPQQGPDGWPYLVVETQDSTQSLNSEIDSAQKVIHWASSRGIGLVVNPKKLPYPDFVFSYGMLWSFRETGYFIKAVTKPNAEKKIIFTAETKLQTGPPSTEYLPQYVRSVLKEFLRDQGVLNPRVLMASTDGENFDLCFSLESLGSPIEAEHEGILEALSWFLPPHYSIALVQESSLNGFISL